MADVTAKCTICLQPFDDSEVERQWFPCSHSVHHPCAMEFSRVLGAPLDELPCPECRIIPDDAQNIVDGLAHDPTEMLEHTMVIDDDDVVIDGDVVMDDDAETQDVPALELDPEHAAIAHPSSEALDGEDEDSE